jgi:hypothetical protein
MRCEDGRSEHDGAAVKFLPYIPEMFNSNLCQVNEHPEMIVIFLSPFWQLLGQHLVQATTVSFYPVSVHPH